MIEEALILGVVGTAVAIIDQQNLIPQLSNNPQKLWFFDPARYAPPATTLQRPLQAVSPLAFEQQRAIMERQREAEIAKASSKYVVRASLQPELIPQKNKYGSGFGGY